MASFQAKIGWKRQRKRENKIIVPFRSNPTRKRNYKKIAKKFIKLNSTIMASFQAKLGWIRPRKRKNKNYRSDHFIPDS